MAKTKSATTRSTKTAKKKAAKRKTTPTKKKAATKKAAKRSSTRKSASAKKPATKKKATAKKASASKKSAKKKASESKSTTAKRGKKAANPDDEVTIDRRRKDRREEIVAETEEIAQPKPERRKKVPRRRQIDPTTCERDYSDDEIEFMHALDEYKRANGRMFPTCSEILEVVRNLGYVRMEKKPDEQPGDGTETPANPEAAQLAGSEPVASVDLTNEIPGGPTAPDSDPFADFAEPTSEQPSQPATNNFGLPLADTDDTIPTFNNDLTF